MKLAAFAVLVGLAACGRAETPPPQESGQAVVAEPAASTEPPGVPAPPVALPVRSIEGIWGVTSIDGETQRNPIVLEIGRDRIDFENCQLVSWDYTLEDGNFRVERRPKITIDINPKPHPCAATFAPDVARMIAIVEGATRVDPAGGNAVTLKGPAGRLTLRSQ